MTAEAQPPCIGCGRNPPTDVTWDLVKYAVQEGEKFIPWTRCPSCASVGESGITSPRDRVDDDITHGREAIQALAERYPLLVYQLDAIIAKIERCFQPKELPPGMRTLTAEYAESMPEEWALPTAEVLRLIAAVLTDARITTLAKAVDALVERDHFNAAIEAMTPENIPARFGQTRVPVSARKLIGLDSSNPIQPPPLSSVAAGPVTVAVGDIQHGDMVGVTLDEGEGEDVVGEWASEVYPQLDPRD